MDRISPEARSRNMSRIRSADTKPEMTVRRLVHAMGFRYRLHVRDLPGRPDLVFQRLRKAIFVHGCFWHRHRCANGRSIPATRSEFWTAKFRSNVDRDRRTRRQLKAAGWQVLTVWECEVEKLSPTILRNRLLQFLCESQ
jgi:DNA mismatch endonuclease, patch repair protein